MHVTVRCCLFFFFSCLFCLHCLFHFVSLVVPYKAQSVVEVASSVLTSGSTLAIDNTWPQPVRSLLQSCLQIQPSDRPTMSSVHTQLTAYCAQLLAEVKATDATESSISPRSPTDLSTTNNALEHRTYAAPNSDVPLLSPKYADQKSAAQLISDATTASAATAAGPVVIDAVGTTSAAAAVASSDSINIGEPDASSAGDSSSAPAAAAVAEASSIAASSVSAVPGVTYADVSAAATAGASASATASSAGPVTDGSGGRRSSRQTSIAHADVPDAATAQDGFAL
jgi:hypothetical protein